jgi:hypothetical protein
MTQWKFKRGKAGQDLVEVAGVLSGPDALRVAEEVERAARPFRQRLVVDLSRARGAIDLLTTRLVELLRDERRAPQVLLRGLNQHHQRLLGYMGLHHLIAHGTAF